MGSRLHRHSSRYGAHRRQQRQATAGIGNGFIGNTGGTALHQSTGKGLFSGQVQIGEQRMLWGESSHFVRLRLFHLENQLSVAPQSVHIRFYLCAGSLKISIAKACTFSSTGLNAHLMAAPG